MSKTGGQLIAEILDRNQVRNVFCVPGESYLGALDALFDKKKSIKVINARHEAGAVNMAESYGKLTGNPGVALVTRGASRPNAAGATSNRLKSFIKFLTQNVCPIIAKKPFNS